MAKRISLKILLGMVLLIPCLGLCACGKGVWESKESDSAEVSAIESETYAQTETEVPSDSGKNDESGKLRYSDVRLDEYDYEPDPNEDGYDPNFFEVVEFESGTNTGNAKIVTGGAGTTGIGSVFIENNASASVTVTVPASGAYHLELILMTYNGEKKSNYILVNDVNIGAFTCNENQKEFHAHEIENVYLKKGDNTITIKASWGWTYFDSVAVIGIYKDKEKTPCAAQLSDPNATLRAQMLYQFLCDINGTYILSGQQGEKGINSNEFQAIYEETGRYPAVFGGDFMDYITEVNAGVRYHF